jgi:hypothetical protein
MAIAAGEIPDADALYWETPPIGTVDRNHRYQRVVELGPMKIPGDMLGEVKLPITWALKPAEIGADASLAEVAARKFIYAQWNMLKKYVSGFENSVISSIGPMLCHRSGARPYAEYTLTPDDISNNRLFPDAVIHRTGKDPVVNGGVHSGRPRSEIPDVSFDIPYRAMLPLKFNNLLVAGDCISFTEVCRVNVLKGIAWSVILGEVAGVSAASAVENNISAKDIKWTSYYTPAD